MLIWFFFLYLSHPVNDRHCCPDILYSGQNCRGPANGVVTESRVLSGPPSQRRERGTNIQAPQTPLYAKHGTHAASAAELGLAASVRAEQLQHVSG